MLPLTTDEFEFLERLNGAGAIVPELLTSDAAMQAALRVETAKQIRGGAAVTSAGRSRPKCPGTYNKSSRLARAGRGRDPARTRGRLHRKGKAHLEPL